MTDTIQPAIKPGDFVRDRTRNEMWYVAAVDHENNRVWRDGNWDTMSIVFAAAECLDVVLVGTAAEERAMVLAMCERRHTSNRGSDERGLLSWKYAGERGWRSLDREDVTAVAIRTEIYDAAGAYLGRITRTAASFEAKHAAEGPTRPSVMGLASYDDALGAILAAENKRRATISAPATEET